MNSNEQESTFVKVWKHLLYPSIVGFIIILAFLMFASFCVLWQPFAVLVKIGFIVLTGGMAIAFLSYMLGSLFLDAIKSYKEYKRAEKEGERHE